MPWLRKLEHHLKPFAVSNLTLYLVVGQAFVYLSAMLGMLDIERLILVPTLVLNGEFWRVFTFVLIPPATSWVFIAFALYLFYLFGSSLEEYWGDLRYNLFLFTGYVLTVGFSFIVPNTIWTNLFIGGAVFLAFAYLNPDFVMYIFFILPVKIKWLGLITWLGYGFVFFTGGLAAKLSIIAAVGNFLLFFAGDIWASIKQGRRRMHSQTKRFAEEHQGPQARHTCRICGKTDISNPELDFRYCSKCTGAECYCPEHIRNHEHILTDNTANR